MPVQHDAARRERVQVGRDDLADVVVQNGLQFGMNVDSYLRDDDKKND